MIRKSSMFISLFRGTFFISLFLFTSNISAQNSYLMSLSNGEKINSSAFEFDVILNGLGENFELTSYQVALKLEIEFSGSVSFIYLESTSELSNIPSSGIGINNNDGFLELTFASMPGSDLITSQEKRVGRFRIECSEPFNNNPSIAWDFSGTITTILTGSSFINITDPPSHISYLEPSSSESENLISEYKLFQNFPNPFNPSTKISFNLKQDGNTKLSVYNLIGEEVTELVNDYLKAGSHEVDFKGENLASGIYIYRLNVDNGFSDFKKMIFMK